MNFCYICTMFSAIFIMALILVTSIEADLVDDLNADRNEPYKTKEDLKMFEDIARNHDETNNVQTRQAFDWLSHIPEDTDNEYEDEEQIVPNCNSDFCKAENRGGGMWCSDRSKYSLKSTKNLSNFLNTLKQENKKLPRETSTNENVQIAGETNGENAMKMDNEKVGEIRASDQNTKGNMEENVKATRQRRFKTRNQLKNNQELKSKKSLWAQNAAENVRSGAGNEQNNVIHSQQNAGYTKSDLSSCQQCSEQPDNGRVKNKYKHKSYKDMPVDIYGNKSTKSELLTKLPKQPKNVDTLKSQLNYFKQKYSIGEQSDSEDNEEEDDMFNLKYPSAALTDSQNKNENQNFPLQTNNNNLFAQDINMEEKKSQNTRSLNSRPALKDDQVENTENNLSHEANYKLSKDEQNASENKKESSWKWSIFKRSQAFNPMHEIMLKTSRRLMQKGLGASLPSYSLGEVRRDIMIDNVIKRREKEMMGGKRNKFNNIHEFFEPSSREANKKMLKELEDMTLEPVVESLPLRDWNSNRQKRITDTIARHKRESKFFIKARERTNTSNNLTNNFKALQALEALKLNGGEMSNETTKALKRTIYELQNSLKNDKTIQVKPAGNTDRYYKAENCQRAFKLQEDDGKFKSYLGPLTEAYSKQFPIRNFVTVTNGTKAFLAKSDYISNYKPLKHRKLSIQRENFRRELRHPRTKRSLRYNLNMAKNSAGNNNLFVTVTRKLFQQARNLQKHIKAFVKKSLNYLPFRRGLNNKTSSQLLNYPNESSANASYKAFEIENNESKAFKLIKAYYINQTGICEKLVNKTLTADNTQQVYIIGRNTKTKYLENKLQNLINLEQFYKRRSKRSVRQFNGVIEKYPENLNHNERDADSFKHLEDKRIKVVNTKSSFQIFINEAEAKINFSKKLLNSRQWKRVKQSSDVDESFYKNLLTNLKESLTRSRKLSEPRKWNDDKYLQKIYAVDKNNTQSWVTESFLKFNPALNSLREGSFDTLKSLFNNNGKNKEKKLDMDFSLKEAFNTEKLQRLYTTKPTQVLSLNKSSTAHISFKINKPKERDKKLEKLEQILNLNKSVELKNDNHKINSQTQSHKRSKRSLSTDFPEDLYKSDKMKFFNKRKYFLNYGDLYRPDFKLNFPYKNPTDQDNDFNRPQKIFSYEEFPKKGKAINSYTDYNIDTIKKLFDREQFDHFKDHNAGSQTYDKQWHDHKARKEFNTPRKRQNSPEIRNFTIDPKTRQVEFKSTKLPFKVRILKDKYLSDLQNFNENYKFNGNNFNWPKDSLKASTDLNKTSTNNAENLSLKLNNEILNCKSLGSLEEFLKSLPKNITQSLLAAQTETNLNCPTTGKIEMDLNTPAVTTEKMTTPATATDDTINCATTTEKEKVDPAEVDAEQTTESCEQVEVKDTSSTEIATQDVTTECQPPTTVDQDDLKLKFTINANVQGNPKNNYYSANGSFNVKPGLMEDRRRREIFLSPLDGLRKCEQLQISQQQPYADNESDNLIDLMSGKLSNNVVKTILNTVQQSPQLKELWPSLKQNLQMEETILPNFYSIRNKKNDKQLKKSEKLLAQAISAINNILEQQVRSQTCVPLRSDLQEFYNVIIQSRQRQDMLHLLEPHKVEEETNVVNNLLKQYEELPRGDQQQVAVVREDLVQNLFILHQLQDIGDRHWHELKQKREETGVKSVGEIMKSLQSHYSPTFLKLLNAAELYREINSK